MILIAAFFVGAGVALAGLYIGAKIESFGENLVRELSRPINIIQKQGRPDAQ